MGGKHDTDYRDTFVGDGPCSLLTLAIKYAWLSVACVILRHGFNPNHYELCDLVLLAKHRPIRMVDDRIKAFIKTIIAAGYKFNTSTLLKLDCLLVPPYKGFSEETIINWIKEQYVLPNLQQLCRNEIRRCLRIHCRNRSILESISQLHLPRPLRDYLALLEIEPPQEDFSVTDVKSLLCKEPLYFAMPKKVPQCRTTRQAYWQFWKQSCCCMK